MRLLENTKVKVLLTQMCLTLCDPVSPLGSSVHGILTGNNAGVNLPFPSPGDLPNPGVIPGSPTLQADSLLSQPPRKPVIENIWGN